MGLTLKAGRWFDPDRPMDDMTQPYPPQPEVEKAIAQRGVNVVLNEYAVRKLGFKSPPGCDREGCEGRAAVGRGSAK